MLGAAGNIGSRLGPYLRAVGYEVLESDHRPGWREGYQVADMTHPLDLLPLFDWKPDVVFLCAALVGRMAGEQAGSLVIATNLGGLSNVLQLCRRVGATCVYFSSSEVYGPQCDPMDEVLSVPRPNNRYGLTKWLGEQLIEYEVRSHGLRAVTVRPCMVYDEHETLGDHRSAMIRFAASLARGRPIEVHRGAARSWLHVEDAVRAFEAASRLRAYTPLNIGHPDIVPMTDLAEMIRRGLGADPSLVQVGELPPRMTLVKRPTLTRQRELLGFEPRIGLEAGVERVCAVQRQLRALEAGTLPEPVERDL